MKEPEIDAEILQLRAVVEQLVEKLIAENKRLRSALKPFADAVAEHLDETPDFQELEGSLTIGHLGEARRVFEQEERK